MAFDTATLIEARESGYSDDEIVSHLSQSDARFQQARDAGYGLDEIAKHFDPTPVEVKPDTFSDDWSGFVANMQIAGNRLLQGITASRLNSVAKTQKSAQLARQAVELGTPEAFNAYAQDRIEELGLAAYPKNDPEAIAKEADILERRWRDESVKIPEFANYLAQKEKRIQELSPRLSPEMQKFNEAKGAEFWKTFASNPVESLANVIASSAIVSAPAIAAGAIGSLAGPVGTAAATGVGSYSVETSQSILDALKSADVDISNPEQVEAAFTDPQMMEKARDFANKRGIPIAIFDAATAGIAGKFIGPALKEVATPTTRAVLAATGKEFLTQAAGGAAGELAAEVTAGQEISAKEIALEALGEIGSGVTEAAGNVRARNKIDSELQRIGSAQPPVAPGTPPVAPETPPVVSESDQEPPAIPAPIVQQEEPVKLSPFTPQKEGPSIVSTAIETPQGIVTGKTWDARHPTMLMEALDKGLSETEFPKHLGFIVQDPDGSQRFASREEALKIAREAGQVDESKVAGNELHSEHLKPIGEPNAVTQPETAQLYGDVQTQPREVEGQVPAEESRRGIPESGQEAQPKVDAEVAAKTLQPFFNQAVEAARSAGASDPESAASQAQIELSQQVARGDTTLTNPRALFLESARRQAGKQKKPQTIPIEEVQEPSVSRGPRAEAVSEEDITSIEQAIERLPETQSRVMKTLIENSGISDAELGKLTGLTEDAAKQAKSRARKTLADFIRKNQIGQQTGPGASNITELRKARYTLASDIYEGLRVSRQLTRDVWEKNILREYGDIFSQDDLNEAWAISQEASEQFNETGSRKPMNKIIAGLLGEREGQGITGIRNKQADLERRKRGLPAAMEAARRTHLSVWDEAMRLMDENPQFQSDTVQKYRDNPFETPSDTETAILLHAQIQAENAYDSAIDDVNSAFEKGDEQKKLEAWSRAKSAETQLIDLYDINKSVGSAAGRSLSARRMMASRDYTLVRMLAEERASRGGVELTETETQTVRENFENIKRTNAELEARINELEEETARKHAESTLSEMQKEAEVDPAVKPLVDRILERLDTAANKARERLKAKLAFVGSSPDPTIIYDLSVIGASKIAHGLVKFSRWSKSMIEEFGDGVKPYLKDAFDAANKRVDDAVESVAPKNEKVKKAVKNPTSEQVVDDMEAKIRERIKDGDSLEDLRPYVQKMALALVRSGTTQLDPLVDSVHAVIEPMVPGTTNRQVMDLISGYGDSKALDQEKAKVILRDLKGQAQQLAKLEDIQSREPLKKTGIERRTPSDAERRLIKLVNEAMRKFGVVVTDPGKQLMGILNAMATGIKNQIKDLTHQIETGERPIQKTRVIPTEQIEALRATRDQLRKTLKDIEGTPEISMEQRVANAEKALERNISELETRIKNNDTSLIVGIQPQSGKLTALRARRDALRNELDALKQADQDLQDTKTFDRLMKAADDLQAKLDRGNIKPETKAAKIEDELVTEARNRLQVLRDQMQAARSSTPEAQKVRMDAAISAVQRSIDAYDQRLKTGNLTPSGKPAVTSPVLDRLRAERDAMRKLVNDLRKGPPMDPVDLALKLYKARLTRANADLQERITKGDFSKKAKRQIDISKDSEAIRLLAENERFKREFENRKLENERKTETALKKSIRVGKEILNVPRAVKSSMDFSAVLRQGGFISFGNPVRAAKNLMPMFQAAVSQQAFERSEAEIRNRPNAGLYKSSKLYLASLDGALDSREEAYRSELSDKIPFVKGSNRAYITFLNRMRADSFDALVGNLQFTPTQEQLKAIAHYINVSTGRGDLGVHGSAAETLSTVLWSPRLLISRLQLLTAEPLLRGDAAGVRNVIAKEYAKAIAGAGVVIALGLMAGADIEDDPRSSDFGKMKIGNTRIDPWMGLQQITVLMSRLISGETKTQKGQIKSIRKDAESNRAPFEETGFDVSARFLRTKLTPLLGTGFDIVSGENVVGEKVTPGSVAKGLLVPLSFSDVVPILEEQGIPKGTAIQLLNLFGMSVQNYEDKKK